MKVTLSVNIVLSEEESDDLKELLGNITGSDYDKIGIRSDQRVRLSEIWDALPDIEESI